MASKLTLDSALLFDLFGIAAAYQDILERGGDAAPTIEIMNMIGFDQAKVGETLDALGPNILGNFLEGTTND